MLLQSIVFPGNDHWKKTECNCLGMYKAVSGPHFIATVHNDWSLWSFSYADLATLQYQATRQGQRPSFRFLVWLLCRPVQATASLEKKRSACAGHLSNPWKKLNNKPSLWMNSKSPIWIVWSFWVWFSSLYPQEIQKLHIFSKKIHGFFGLSHAVTKVCRMYTWEFLLGNLLRSLGIHLEKNTRLRM